MDTLYSWQSFTLLSMLLVSLLYLKSSNNSLCFQTWKTICLIQPLRSLQAVQVVIFTCCNIIAFKWHDFDQTVSQVCTLLCNQTWWLYVKFMQHCCKWTTGDLFMWHHHYWTSDCLCIFHAIKLWSILELSIHMFCDPTTFTEWGVVLTTTNLCIATTSLQ